MTSPSGFWERRKAAVRVEEEAARKAEEAKAEAARQAELEAESDENILAKLDLPDPESLGAGDDFSAFMSKAVPDRLRRRALRKLWLSNPVLANLDELVEYGEDFTDAATVAENLQTAYQIGKGMLAHIEAQAAEREKAEADGPVGEGSDEEPGLEGSEPERDLSADAHAPAAVSTSDAARDGAGERPFQEAAKPAMAKRRMRFSIAGEGAG